jgi:hypothetical protein
VRRPDRAWSPDDRLAATGGAIIVIVANRTLEKGLLDAFIGYLFTYLDRDLEFRDSIAASV